ncbi:MAG TPA: hypothetical protein PLG75_01700 [Methanoculleus sp.]|nr:hypothetical protein [Methanoculleus sp.]
MRPGVGEMAAAPDAKGGRVYPGYRVGPNGRAIGLTREFVAGLAAAGIFGLLYTMLANEE